MVVYFLVQALRVLQMSTYQTLASLRLGLRSRILAPVRIGPKQLRISMPFTVSASYFNYAPSPDPLPLSPITLIIFILNHHLPAHSFPVVRIHIVYDRVSPVHLYIYIYAQRSVWHGLAGDGIT